MARSSIRLSIKSIKFSKSNKSFSTTFQGPPSFSRTFKASNLHLLNSKTFKDFQGKRGTPLTLYCTLNWNWIYTLSSVRKAQLVRAKGSVESQVKSWVSGDKSWVTSQVTEVKSQVKSWIRGDKSLVMSLRLSHKSSHVSAGTSLESRYKSLRSSHKSSHGSGGTSL